jgi:hypothetical protein
MSGSERTGTTLLAALGLVLGAIALWQPVGPIADSPGQRLVLDVPAWVQFVLLGATLVEFLAIVLVMIPNRLKKRSDGTLQRRPSAMRLSPIEKMALLLPLAAVAIAAYQSQYFESGRFGWLFGSRGGWFGSSSADVMSRNPWDVIPPCLPRVRAHPRRPRQGTEPCSRFSCGRAGSARPAGCPSACR